ncbi:MAG: DEAD/DEAH box helicase family protein [Planctomycetia bacterium]|uniref:Restriction endonuclease n=1 Tax=Candidatus Brocadia sapporoensis TaxID=392547 RepID=A0A1V6LZZ1_9BACT|nr:DEAD/DEAH box helicase family protein [Candidatus Brocadia sapporoensis]MCC7237929.1 DEAD/DEAH box helicase family protein [Candidatus Brocadia sp.]QOJ06708.1 MAG: DEAD/DEAH box helicase family protein [Planctomycetia bacterium]TVL94679.1 MAG: restriction endonuclease [Candidatus Brocadia sp. BL1]OQD45732.1 restriction endonuclease [Candidatus Brocadia sapporoensis]HQU32476.1 DEAD/DEAH box helicase family protein [Candidatus Brocadia sapporoensis]
MSNKKDLSERDICTQFIFPALVKAGWNVEKQVREEVFFTDGRIFVKGKKTVRGKRKRADFILYLKPNIPLAVIEAKDNNHSVGAGLQQALEYAEILDVPVAFSSNGDGFVQHDRSGFSDQIEKELSLDTFPSSAELWKMYKKHKNIETPEQEEIASFDYFFDGSGRAPRYYQQIAINRTVEAVARGQNRILLVMATGTGKTYTAFQIIYRLWKNGRKKRILFLADRNVLIDQTRRNDFKHFKDRMTVIKKKKIDKAFEIYLALYQGLTNYNEDKDAYKEFSPDFFDLVVVDECHRGSAAADSAWRAILDYFRSATHIGLTATPRETREISNIGYFGEPIYTYTLRQGIEDGFLAPYKVLRVGFNIDLEGWRPETGKTDKDGIEVEDRIYNARDFDKNLVIDERTKLVAKKVSEYLRKTNRYDKTIVFCVDIEHAERMRQAIANENQDLTLENCKYVMRITGDDEQGKREVDNFINPEERYPVIATTSKLMTTGVDAQTCKLIVLDSNIRSMTEFKQIIGRGTRINEEYDKTSFAIMDFRNVTNLFADPAFDGDPVMIREVTGEDELTDQDIHPEENQEIIDPETGQPVDFKEEIPDEYSPQPDIIQGGEIVSEPPPKVYVAGVDVSVLNERVQHLDANGNLITESLKDYTKKGIVQEFQSLDDFLTRWNNAHKKKAIIEELESQGIIPENLMSGVKKDLDVFDLICHIAWDMPALTRRERAENVKKRNYFTKYGEKARKVIEALLDKYADEGIENIEDLAILRIEPFNQIGTPTEIVQIFGGREQYLHVIEELEYELYTAA